MKEYYIVRIYGEKKSILSFWAENKEDAMKYISGGIHGLDGLKITVTTKTKNKKGEQTKDENFTVTPNGLIAETGHTTNNKKDF